MNPDKLRKAFFDFFANKGHDFIDSAPIVIKDDPSLMFTNAGMNQFKDIFLGNTNSIQKRVVNTQKCLRVSGKHNDLEEVGHDTYHHTMFEMLGNWSFGDYFKQNAIAWAWEFLTDVCKLDRDRIYVTVFEGSLEDKIAKDQESFDIWKNYLPKERILNGSKKDNFWEMGEIGPCGPCSEIHYDNRTENMRLQQDGKELVNQDHPQVVEIWNLVFIQFDRKADGSLIDLPEKHVDTGMGFERLCMIMQGVQSNYDTTIFQPLIQNVAQLSNLEYGSNEKHDIAMRVIADHLRAVVFAIADGQIPSNVKAGYVIRRILRRSVRYAYTFLRIKEPFMYALVPILIKQFEGLFDNLKSQKDLIQKVIKEEEESFLRTLKDGLKRIEQLDLNTNATGEQVFELYDTYGFPADLTALILAEKGLTYDSEGFEECMRAQKNRSRVDGKVETGDWILVKEDKEEGFVGYNSTDISVNISRYRKIKNKDGDFYQLVFNRTPFYPEGGGQVGDIGILEHGKDQINILDTKKENKVILHWSKNLPVNICADFTAKVDKMVRQAISCNHTATHLLHESLRNILGAHVEQKGSLVSADYLRFDFTHFAKLEKDQLQAIEEDVNNKIRQNINLKEHVGISLSQAKKEGAIMLFGEKYEELVRMVQFNNSKELCGGTHVSNTSELGIFSLQSESSISSGIRRIEACTSNKAYSYLKDQERQVKELVKILKNKDVKVAVEKLILDLKKQEKQLALVKKDVSSNLSKEFLQKAETVSGIRLITEEVSLEANEIKQICFSLRASEKNLVVVLIAKNQEKLLVNISVTDDLIKKGIEADKIIKEIAKVINGGGGGQSTFATAGGTASAENISKVLLLVKELINK